MLPVRPQRRRSDATRRMHGWTNFRCSVGSDFELVASLTRSMKSIASTWLYNTTTFGNEFPSYECKTFHKKLQDVTRNARTTSNIVRPIRSHVTGNTRAYGGALIVFVCLFHLLIILCLFSYLQPATPPIIRKESSTRTIPLTVARKVL